MVGAFAISMIRGRRDRVHFPSARRKMPPIYFAWKATTEGFFATAGWLPRALVVVAALAPWAAPARAESAYCDDLKAEIAQAGGGGDLGRYRAAAAKQQVELGRTAAYARSIGCERQQFLFFGEPPPPQCAQINARVAQMQANLAALQQRSGDNGRKLALTARYDAQCRESSRVTSTAASPLEASRGFFEQVFGLAPPREAGAPPFEPFPFHSRATGRSAERDGGVRAGRQPPWRNPCDLRAPMRRRLFSHELFGSARQFRRTRRALQSALSQRRGGALYEIALGRARLGRFDQRRQLRRSSQRAEVPKDARPRLRLQAAGQKLGGGPRRGRAHSRGFEQ